VQRQPRNPQLAPGLEKMLDLLMMEKIQARPPPPSDLAKAWAIFIKHKLDKKESVLNYQARHLLMTFRHCRGVDEKRGAGAEPTLTNNSLKRALLALRMMPPDDRETHSELAGELFEELRSRTKNEPTNGLVDGLGAYIYILSATDDTEKARDFLMPLLVEMRADPVKVVSCWRAIMDGFVREDNEKQLLRSFQMQTVNDFLAAHLFRFYMDHDNVAATKKWYSFLEEKSSEETKWIRKPDLDSILQFSLRNNEQQWCNEIFRKIIEKKPTNVQWDVIFKWAAGSMGKGVEDVEHMIEVMIRVGRDNGEAMEPTMETINGLVSVAMARKDPYLAERYIALGRKFGLQPNAQTYILQMDYRITAGDMTGASAAYDALQSEEVEGDSDIPVMNRYIRALCSTPSLDYEFITSITDDLDQRGAPLEPDTVSSLCVLYLERGETDLMIDILQVHSFKYTIDQRSRVRQACLDYTLSPNTATGHAWECYQVFIHIFQETPIEQRTIAMQEFFRRRRSDMALHVFGHMRAHDNPYVRPVLSTYVDCFEGIARCHDKPSLDVVHNMLKMDISIEPNTELYNALLLAYTECGDSSKALRFWDDITNSREGPNYRSLELVFHACARKPFGDVKAREIWAKMRRMDIEVTRNVFIAYVCALGGNSKLDDAKAMVESGNKEFGLPPDLMT
jgi:hypothetical protein